MAKQLKITVHSPNGSEREYGPLEQGTITIGNIRGCTIFASSAGPFCFTLFSRDSRRDLLLLFLTDAVKGEFFADGETRSFKSSIRDGSATGVEALGIWCLPLPVPCSGYLTIAGLVISFEAGEGRTSDFHEILERPEQGISTAKSRTRRFFRQPAMRRG